jgi:hypothetical protein
LAQPDTFGLTRLHPIVHPEIMIPQDVGDFFQLQQIIDTLFCVRPSVAHVSETDQMIFRLKSRSFNTLPQSAVSTVYITDYESSAHAIEPLMPTFCQKFRT